MKQIHSVLILGGTTFDHVVTLPQLPAPEARTVHSMPFHEGTGSTGAGKAFALTKLGVPVTLYSALGDDWHGRAIIDDLRNQGVPFYYQLDPRGTERHINLMDEEGRRISLFVTQSSEWLLFDAKVIQNLIQRSQCLVLNIISYCRQFISLLNGYPHPIWTDLHDYDGHGRYYDDFIEAAQYIHLSSDKLPNFRPVMQQLIGAGKKLVVCTHGAAGATLLTADGQWLEQSAWPVLAVVDSNGAGDSFFAGFLYGWLRGRPLAVCLRYGAICGAWCVTTRGLGVAGLSGTRLEQIEAGHLTSVVPMR